ncbi:hypothetical protein CHS0354_027394 [Potamilus streckersoni]|uniref:RNA polymerase sigma-54 factor n=1 Tax=Potamilus streckersoni TaxID=2493646 RepID=A0AAE0SQD2_9BIVA|nr:hypothetical protein CHS0354_027394 [Potamilus streckersoni]
MDLGLQVKQTQSLIMTPQLQQAIKLLQLSRYELEQLIDQSLIENPALELLSDGDTDGEGDYGRDNKDQQSDDDSWNDDSEESYLERETSESRTGESDSPYDEWDAYVGESGDSFSESTGGKQNQDEEHADILENTVTKKESLISHLIWQINLSFDGEEEKKVARNIVSYIDNDGYLTVSLREIIALSPTVMNWCKAHAVIPKNGFSEEILILFDEKYSQEKGNRRTNLAHKLIKNISIDLPDGDDGSEPEAEIDLPKSVSHVPDHYCAAIDKVLKKIQQLDPSGVGARSVRECLLLQLEAMNMKGSLPVIRELEPKPGRPFEDESTQYIIPDVFIYKRNGVYNIRLNGETLPRLRVSPQYLEMAKQQHLLNLKRKKEKNEGEEDLTEAYLNEKIRAGEWLIKSIDQRQRTIYKVAESILKNQRDFFEDGISALKPMILKVVAEDIGVHESTVSRITNNKFVHTPQGIFELKYFFTSGVTQEDGDTISSKKIKNLIKQLIQKENPKKTLYRPPIGD